MPGGDFVPLAFFLFSPLIVRSSVEIWYLLHERKMSKMSTSDPPINEVSIRRPRPGDGAGMARAWLDAGVYYASRYPDLFQIPETEGLAAMLESWALGVSSEDTCVLVAEADGQVVGFIQAVVEQPITNAAYQFVREPGQIRATINVIVVAAAYRCRRIGTRLMQAAEEWARTRGAAVLLLDTFIESDLSIPFYEHLAYRRRAVHFGKSLE